MSRLSSSISKILFCLKLVKIEFTSSTYFSMLPSYCEISCSKKLSILLLIVLSSIFLSSLPFSFITCFSFSIIFSFSPNSFFAMSQSCINSNLVSAIVFVLSGMYSLDKTDWGTLIFVSAIEAKFNFDRLAVSSLISRAFESCWLSISFICANLSIANRLKSKHIFSTSDLISR